MPTGRGWRGSDAVNGVEKLMEKKLNFSTNKITAKFIFETLKLCPKPSQLPTFLPSHNETLHSWIYIPRCRQPRQ